VRQKKKKWLVPTIAAAAVVILLAVIFYFITQKSVGPPGPALLQTEETAEKKQPLEQSTADKEEQPIDAGTKTETKKDTKDTETDLDTKKGKDQPMKETGKKEISPPKEEQKPVKKYDPDLKQPGKQEKTEPLKIEKKEEKPKPVKKQVKPPEVKTVNLLEVSPALREVYNKRLQRIQIIVRKARFQVHGQVTLELLIDEKGKVSVSSVKDMLTVKPEVQQSKAIEGIKRRISYISLPPPRDKEGNRVRFNWRITYKVGKYLNRIILTKQ
jgi:hypothetical protein